MLGVMSAVLGVRLLAPATVVQAASTQPPSGIGDAVVTNIAVSPDYQRTGVVVVAATSSGPCSQCQQLWVSRDGGNSYRQAAAANWQTRAPIVAVDGHGRDLLFAGSDHGVQRSDDLGETWTTIPGTGSPVLVTASPQFSHDATVAIASSPQDFMLQGTAVHPVGGTAGSEADVAFMLAPHYPSGGKFSPALIAGMDLKTRAAVVERCTAAMACQGAVTLPGTTQYSNPVVMYPSTAYDDDGALFALSQQGVFKSTDGGASFLPLQIGVTGANASATTGFGLAPGYREAGPVRTGYAAVIQLFQDAADPGKNSSAGGVYRTNDGGSTWTRVGTPSPLDSGSMAMAVAPNGRLFAGYVASTTNGGHAGLLCSTDSGATWSAFCPSVGHGPENGVVPNSSAPTCAPTGCVHRGKAPGAASHGGTQPGGGTPKAGGSSPATTQHSSAAVGALKDGPAGRSWLGVVLLVVGIGLAVVSVARRWSLRGKSRP